MIDEALNNKDKNVMKYISYTKEKKTYIFAYANYSVFFIFYLLFLLS